MNIKNISAATLLAATCAAAAVGLSLYGTTAMTRALGGGYQWQASLGPPGAELGVRHRHRRTQNILSHEGFSGELAFHRETPEVTIVWRYADSGLRLNQSFRTSYWPSSVIAMRDASSFVVAGKRRGNRNTVIEEWVISAPELIYDLGTGEPGAIDAPSITSIETLYDDAVEGRDLVRVMIQERGVGDDVIVQFHDSGDVWKIARSEPFARSQVASVAPGSSGALVVPGLDEVRTNFWGGTHPSYGFVYVLGQARNGGSNIVLVDSDMNGAVESSQHLSHTSWAQSTLSDVSAYLSIEP